MDVDGYLKQLGHFGKFQTKVYVLSLLPCWLAGVVFCQVAFLNAEPQFRCKIHQCDSEKNYTATWTESIRQNISDKGLTKCHRPKPDLNITCNQAHSVFQDWDWNNETISEKCTEWIFDQTDYKETTASEWKLVCDKNGLRTTTSLVATAGVLVGAFICGLIADWLGRRSLYWILPILGCGIAVGASFAPSIGAFMALAFLVCAISSGMYVVAYVVGVEYIGPKYRTWTATFVQVVFCFGELTICLVAYLGRDWRVMERVVAGFFLLMCFLGLFLPESVRWLVSRGRDPEAKVIIKKAANTNKVTLVDMPDKPSHKGPKDSFFSVFKHMRLRRWTINMYFNWIVNAFVYYGLSFAADDIGKGRLNVYQVWSLMSFVSMIFIMGITYFMEKFGRKWTLVVDLLLAGASCFVGAFVNGLTGQIFCVLGKGFIAGSFALIYVLSSEIFPTSVRAAGVGSCSMMSRIGMLIAPKIAPLDFWGGKPKGCVIVCGILSLVAGLLSLDFPETKGNRLPTRIEDLDNPDYNLPSPSPTKKSTSKSGTSEPAGGEKVSAEKYS